MREVNTSWTADELKRTAVRVCWIFIGPCLQAVGIAAIAYYCVHRISGTDPKSELTEYAAASIVENADERLSMYLSDKIRNEEDYYKARMAKLPKCSK